MLKNAKILRGLTKKCIQIILDLSRTVSRYARKACYERFFKERAYFLKENQRFSFKKYARSDRFSPRPPFSRSEKQCVKRAKIIPTNFSLRLLTSLILRIPIFLCPVFLLILSCDQPKPGCTDIRATNFDVAAAKADNINCTFPKLIFQVAYVVGDSSFSEANIYRNAKNQPFKIVQSATYLSDFQFITNDNKISKTIDSIALYRQTDTIRALNSFALIGRNNGFSFTIGTFEDVGKTFTKCQFNLGLTAEVNKTDATKMPFGHPLSIRADSMYNRTAKKYTFNKIVVVSGTNFKDTLRLELANLEVIKLDKTIKTIEGSDVVISLVINYLKLFDSVDFTEAQTTTKDKMTANAKNVFLLK